jgi:hypothetical protein
LVGAALEHKLHNERLSAIASGRERRKQQQRTDILEAGRAPIGTTKLRHRVQAHAAAEAAQFQQRLASTQPRFATPSAIAVLRGEGAGGAKGSARRRAQNAAERAA